MGPRNETMSVPVGLEQLLLAAAADPALRAELLRDRALAAERRGLALTESERAVLTIATADQLAAMIDHLDTSERSLAKHKFMRAVAAAAVTLAAGTGLGACGGSEEKPTPETGAPFKGQAEQVEVEVGPVEPAGTRPVDTIEVPQPEPMPPGGARPDVEPVEIEIPKPERNGRGGARPDIGGDPLAPTLKIDEPERNLDGGARPDFDED